MFSSACKRAANAASSSAELSCLRTELSRLTFFLGGVLEVSTGSRFGAVETLSAGVAFPVLGAALAGFDLDS